MCRFKKVLSQKGGAVPKMATISEFDSGFDDVATEKANSSHKQSQAPPSKFKSQSNGKMKKTPVPKRMKVKKYKNKGNKSKKEKSS